jgi:hypothetical protein
MKQVLYKGIPLASVSIVVAVPKPFLLSVSADPSWGKKIFLETSSQESSLTRDQVADLAQALTKAGIIMDDIEIRDDGADALVERADALRDANEFAWDDLQDTLDGAVHDLASREASSTNNTGAEEQIRYLVDMLGAEEVEKMITDAEEKNPSGQTLTLIRAHGEPMCANPKMVGGRCATCGLVSSLPATSQEGEDNGE